MHWAPHSLADLTGHRIVRCAASIDNSGAGFDYVDPADQRYKTLPMASLVSLSGTDAYQAAAIAGLEIIQAPMLGLNASAASDTLMLVIPEYSAPPLPVSLMLANRGQLAPQVQAIMQ